MWNILIKVCEIHILHRQKHNAFRCSPQITICTVSVLQYHNPMIKQENHNVMWLKIINSAGGSQTYWTLIYPVKTSAKIWTRRNAVYVQYTTVEIDTHKIFDTSRRMRVTDSTSGTTSFRKTCEQLPVGFRPGPDWPPAQLFTLRRREGWWDLDFCGIWRWFINWVDGDVASLPSTFHNGWRWRWRGWWAVPVLQLTFRRPCDHMTMLHVGFYPSEDWPPVQLSLSIGLELDFGWNFERIRLFRPSPFKSQKDLIAIRPYRYKAKFFWGPDGVGCARRAVPVPQLTFANPANTWWCFLLDFGRAKIELRSSSSCHSTTRREGWWELDFGGILRGFMHTKAFRWMTLKSFVSGNVFAVPVTSH